MFRCAAGLSAIYGFTRKCRYALSKLPIFIWLRSEMSATALVEPVPNASILESRHADVSINMTGTLRTGSFTSTSVALRNVRAQFQTAVTQSVLASKTRTRLDKRDPPTSGGLLLAVQCLSSCRAILRGRNNTIRTCAKKAENATFPIVDF